MKTILMMLGFLLIYIAVDYKRPKEHQFSLFSWDGFIQWGLIVSGAWLLVNLTEC